MGQLLWNTKVRAKQVEPLKGETQNYHETQQFHSWELLDRYSREIDTDRYSRETKTYIQTNTSAQMLLMALFILISNVHQ